jgi:hypothetical protein
MRYRVRQGGKNGRVVRELAYRIPASMVEYVLGLSSGKDMNTMPVNPTPSPGQMEPERENPLDLEQWDEELESVVECVQVMQLSASPHQVRMDLESEEVVRCVAKQLCQ